MHTVPPLLAVFDRLAAELLPGVQLFHILDEPLLERIRQRGYLAPSDVDQLRRHAAIAEEIGADAVLITCSTVSPHVDKIRPYAHIPILKIDEAMIVEAVKKGTRIGVVATAVTTLEPTRQMLQTEAETAGKTIEIELILVENALSALSNGDGQTHDRLVRQAVLELSQRVDVVVLAQASMARVLSTISKAERPTLILSSPHLALAKVKQLLQPLQ